MNGQACDEETEKGKRERQGGEGEMKETWWGKPTSKQSAVFEGKERREQGGRDGEEEMHVISKNERTSLFLDAFLQLNLFGISLTVS